MLLPRGAPERSPARGWAGATGPGQWAHREKGALVSVPPTAPRSPRSSAARLLPEGARGARRLHRRTPGSSPLLPAPQTSLRGLLENPMPVGLSLRF